MGGFKFVIELLIAELLFGIYLPKRPKFLIIYISCALACLLLGYFIPGPKENVWFIVLIFFYFFCTMLTQFAWLNTNVWNDIFVGVAGYTVQHLAQQPKNILMVYIYPAFVEKYGEVISKINFETIIGVFCDAVIYFFVWLLFARRLKGSELDTNKRKLVIVSLLVVCFSVVLSGITSAATDTTVYVIQKLYALTCCLLTLFLLSGLVQEKSLEKELEVLRQLQNKDKEHYELSKETISLINEKCHDMKYLLRKTIDENPKIDDEETSQIENAISIYDSVIKSGNEALDTILTEKSLYCEKNKIVLSCIADGNKLSFMKDVDIYSLFGNLMDNAIEAVVNLPNADERRISLQIKTRGELLSIHSYNKYLGEIKFQDDVPLTTKESNGYHGYGIKSMRMIVDKYDGVMKINAEDNIFTVDIMFSLGK
jgi:hypothetical protein